jgi:hypothetical protein
VAGFRVRGRAGPDSDRFFALTRVPMGACWSCAVAQTVTDIVCDHTRDTDTEVVVLSMIDNIKVASDNETSFLAAVRRLARIVRELNRRNLAHKRSDLWQGSVYVGKGSGGTPER